MRQLLLCTLFCVALLLATSASAQPDTLWSATAIGDGNTILLDACAHSGGGFVATGYSENDFTSADAFIVRFDESGSVLWTRHYLVGMSNEQLDAVVEVDNGNLMVAGYVNGGETMALMGISPAGDSLWAQLYSPQGLTKARDLIRLSDGNVAVIGYRLGENQTNSDIWLLKCDTGGDTLWTRTYGGDQTDLGYRVAELDNGDLLCVGITRQIAEPNHWDIWLQRATANGDPVGQPQTFGSSDHELCYGLAVDYEGGWYISGKHEIGTSGVEGYLLHVPPEGEPRERSYGNGGQIVQMRGVLPQLNTVLCAGWAGNTTWSTHPYMASIDLQGEVEWTWQFGETGSDNGFYGITELSSGALAYGSTVIGGIRYGFILRIAPPGGAEGHVTDRISHEPVPGVWVSATGQQRHAVTDVEGYYSLALSPGTYDLVTWGFCFDPDTVYNVVIEEEELTPVDMPVGVPLEVRDQSSVNMLAYNHVQSAGTYTFSNAGSGDLSFWIEDTETNPVGDWLWVTPETGTVLPGESMVFDVNVLADTTDDGIYDFFGELYVLTNSCPDTFHVVPVLVTVLDADDPLPNTVEDFALHPAYPNPFNSATTIRFDLPVAARARLDLFDVTGRWVRVLADDRFGAGPHRISVRLPELPTGVYLVRLTDGDRTAAQKITLIR